MKKVISLLCFLSFYLSASASHVAGGEVWYEHDTLNDYIVHLKLYRECGGVAFGTTQNMTVSSASLSTSFNITVDTAGSNIPINPNVMNTCYPNTCNNPSANSIGYEVWHYAGSVTLPNVATDWTFAYATCCRNAFISNIAGPSSTGTYVSATLNNSAVLFNNGLSVPYNAPCNFGFGNQSASYAVVETDGDSLDYQLVAARSAYSTVAYSIPNTPFNPFPNTALSFNSQTGVLNFTPTNVGLYIIAIETREYRNGVLIGSSLRDYQLSIGSSIVAGNIQPSLSGVNGSTSFSDSLTYCGGTPAINLNFNSSDSNALDSTTVTMVVGPVGAAISTNTAQNQTATINWPVNQSMVQAQPHILVLEVQDNNCGLRQEVYQLYVNNCSTDSVWAGDANADFTCDNFDVLSIGVASGQAGPVRVGATTNWQAEWCANWSNVFLNNVNYKHVDCNGDGIISNADLAAITANYGLVHTKTGNVGQYKTAGLPDLYCDMTNVQAHKGSTVTIPVMLGTSGSVIDDFYGISATVELLNAQTSAPISISKNTSWIGNASNSFEFERSLATNKAAFTFVRNDQTNLMAQQGQIGEITFPIDASSVNGSEVTVQFSDIKIIKNSGEEINDFNVLADKLTILAPLAVRDIEKGFTAAVYPNPTKSNMTIALNIDKTQSYGIALYDIVGRLLDNNIFNGTLNFGEHNLELDLTGKAVGQYQLEITSESGKTVLPIQKR